MPRPLTRAEVAALAESLEHLAAELASGVMVAPAATVYRLEGALVALRVSLGEQAIPDNWSAATMRPVTEQE